MSLCSPKGAFGIGITSWVAGLTGSYGSFLGALASAKRPLSGQGSDSYSGPNGSRLPLNSYSKVNMKRPTNAFSNRYGA